VAQRRRELSIGRAACGPAPEEEIMARILVVDDDPAIRQLLTDVLEMDGYEVSVAVDGLAAVEAVQATNPDFVILDVMMPGLDGYGVLSVVRAQPGEPVPVLMLTAAAESDADARAWAGGVDYYLAKPFTVDAVLDLIDGVLAGQVSAGDG
jgi:DNA-binding response OmpR family regulator